MGSTEDPQTGSVAFAVAIVFLVATSAKADELEWLHRTIGSHASYAQPGDMFTSDVGILNVTVEQIRPAVARPMRMLLIAPALRPISPERDSAPLNSLPK